MEPLRAHIFETERGRAIRIRREKALKADLADVEGRERRDDIKGGRARAVTAVEAVVLRRPGLLSG